MPTIYAVKYTAYILRHVKWYLHCWALYAFTHHEAQIGVLDRAVSSTIETGKECPNPAGDEVEFGFGFADGK